MDGITDSEAIEIWDRVSQYIDVSDLKGTSQEEIADEIREKIKSISKGDKKDKATRDTLLKKGFADRITKTDKYSEEKGFQEIAKKNRDKDRGYETLSEDDLREFYKRKDEIKRMPRQELAQLFSASLPAVAHITPKGRISLRVKNRTRTYNPNNLKFTYSYWKNQSAMWISRDGKILTWHLLKTEGYSTTRLSKPDLKKRRGKK